MKMWMVGGILALSIAIIAHYYFENPAIYACCIWGFGSLLIASIWIWVYKKQYIIRSSNDSNPMCIEIVGFYLTLVGLLFALNSDILLETNDMRRSLYRMFDKENKVDFSKLFPTDTVSDDLVNSNPHVIIGIDVSGSLDKKTGNRWTMDSEFKIEYEKIWKDIYDFVNLFSGENGALIEGKMDSLKYDENASNKFDLFRLRALQFIMRLDSLNRMEGYDKKLNLTIVKFGKFAHLKYVGKDYTNAIPYILDLESKASTKMAKNTDFVQLFCSINNHICSNANEKNRQKRPQYIFAFFTDFLHDPKEKNENFKYYSPDIQRKLIRRELEKFNSKSNFSTFYFFPSDTILGSYGGELKHNKVFSVFPLLKSDDDWMNVKPVFDVNMIDLGVYRTKECLAFYYTKPYVVEDNVEVKLTFDDYREKRQFTFALKDMASLPLRDQYVFYTGTDVEHKRLLGKIPRSFEAYRDVPVTMMFQGYVHNQIPSRIFELKDVASGRVYEFDAIFIKDFSPWVKYVFFSITYIFIVMIAVKLYKSCNTADESSSNANNRGQCEMLIENSSTARYIERSDSKALTFLQKLPFFKLPFYGNIFVNIIVFSNNKKNALPKNSTIFFIILMNLLTLGFMLGLILLTP